MNNIILDKTYFLEIPTNLTNGAAKINFPQADLQDLNGKFLQGLTFYTVKSMPKVLTGTATANTNLLLSSFLTLVIEKNEIWNLPVVDLITQTQADLGSPFKIEFNNLPVQWGKCYITVADTATFPAAVEMYAINIAYSDTSKS